MLSLRKLRKTGRKYEELVIYFSRAYIFELFGVRLGLQGNGDLCNALAFGGNGA